MTAPTMEYYPVFLSVTARRCVVVGGGEVAARKAESLLDAGAEVTVVSPEATAAIASLAAAGRLDWVRRPYRSGDLQGAILAYAATDDDHLHAAIAADARAERVFLNVADRPQWCDFIVPSIARRGDLVVAVSTSGRSPAMARRVRQDIESMLTDEYEAAIALFDRLRRHLVRRGWSFERRREIFDRLLQSDVLTSLRRADRQEVDRLLAEHTGEPISAASLEAER
jgi:precorrin-2 dehydrogenase/sirohydrochlorin ferrochelatase